MRYQDAGPRLFEQRGHGVRNHPGIERTGIGRDRTEELIQRFRLAVELHVVEVPWPFAEPELIEEQLIEGGGLDRGCHGAIAGATAARLIDEINRITTTQKEGLKTFAAV